MLDLELWRIWRERERKDTKQCSVLAKHSSEIDETTDGKKAENCKCILGM